MPTKLSKAAAEFNVSFRTLAAHLNDNGYEIDVKPTSKLDDDMYGVLLKEFRGDLEAKKSAEEINIGTYKQEAADDTPVITKSKPSAKDQEEIIISTNLAPAPEVKEEKKVEAPVAKKEVPKKKEEEVKKEPVAKKEEAPKEKVEKAKAPKLAGAKVISKIDLDPKKSVKKEKVEIKKSTDQPKKEEVKPAAKKTKEKPEIFIERVKAPKLAGAKVVGKIELPPAEKKGEKKQRTRKRVLKTDRKPTGNTQNRGGNRGGTRGRGRGKTDDKPAVSAKEIQDKIKATMAKLGGGASSGKSRRDKYRKDKRNTHAENEAQAREEAEAQEKILQVTEFIAVNELASLLDVGATDVISKCFSLGIMVSINQRIDAEIIELVASEYGYEVEFINLQEESDDALEEIVDAPEDLVERAPIVTVMGHVDHGKTSLLDYIRETNVIAGESGGITQHIGAYEVTTESGKKITFLDTPGHEAFTAMRARGAKVTDVAVIVVAADDAVMPQTKEAISHAQAAGVPMIFAINKVDLETANPDKILEQLSQINVLTEAWGGKHQSQNISAKTGLNVDELLDKVILESEVLELKANPDRAAVGTIIEASLDKGKGFVATLLVQSGTLRVGDFVVSGSNFGRVKALYNERNQKMKEAPPSTPAIVLGLDGAPQAGERFQVFESEQEAKAIANKRQQILREQGIRTQKHITLDEIGRRLALGNFKELNVIVKGDVDGSIEALSDSLLKLSTEEIQVNVIHKSVGGISESDVLLASASDAIIIGFQVRPSLNARKAAEAEAVEIRLYSVIYDAIEEVKAAMEGLLEPTFEEKITCQVHVQEIFKVSRVGTIAGCLVKDGKITRNTKIRLVREGIVKYEGELESLKRHKDDAKEVANNMECGIKIKNYNDIKVDDIIEGYEMVEIKRTLK